MNGYEFQFCKTRCLALPSGGLYLPDHAALCVSDLHLGKSERIARRSGVMLPPYEVQETFGKLAQDINICNPQTVICLGDSFDDIDAANNLPDAMRHTLIGMQAGRNWVWIEGNHDPGPIDLGGTNLRQIRLGELTFRHIATDAKAEVSGHYHPKHRVAGHSKPAFLIDATRIIMPAYGVFTGGLRSNASALGRLFNGPTLAILTGTKAIAVPFKP